MHKPGRSPATLCGCLTSESEASLCRRAISQEVCHGAETRTTRSDEAEDARPVAENLSSMWQPGIGGPSQPPDGDDVRWGVSSDFEGLPLSQSQVPTVLLRVSARGRRRMGVTARRIRAGCDCTCRYVALPAATQHPADPPGTAEARGVSGRAYCERSALSL